MLTDEQRRACIDASGHPEGEISQDEFDGFEAGIAYAQTQQAAMIAQARAEEREACAKVCDELARTQRETNDKYPMHALAYPQWRERISYYEQCATAIRARKDGQ